MFLITSYQLGHPDMYRWRRPEVYSDYWDEGPSSSGLFGLRVNVLYRGGKTIKYCLITCVPINAVGDCVACLKRGYVEAEFKITGPITSGTYTWTVSDGWYNSTIDSVYFEKVELQYMDGSVETITGEKLTEDLQKAVEQQKRQKRQEQLQEQLRRQQMSALSRFVEDHIGCLVFCGILIFGLLLILALFWLFS